MAAETDHLADVDSVADLLTNAEPLDGDRIRYLIDALDAADDDALAVLADRIECHTAHGGTVEPRLAALRAQARNREAKAALALFCARAAEGAGDAEAARTLIDGVLTVRPGLEPALHDAAQYAATRGDYPTADRYLRRAARPSPLRSGLTQALAVTEGNVPRNNPCPCGSGRKFKVCCRRDGAPPLAARAVLVYALLGTYAERAPGVEMIRGLLERTEDTDRCAMFLLDIALFRGGLVERFLAARGHWLRPDERDLIERWRQVPVTLYEVLAVQRGTGATLRPLPDGEPIDLADELFSSGAQRLELFCGRVLHDDNGPRLFALPVHVPRHHRRALLGLLAHDPSNEQIADFLGPEPPVQTRNSDGDDVHDCRVTYQVPSPPQTFERLAQRLTPTGDDVVAWHRPVPDGRVISLGEIIRSGDELTVTANSPARLAELETILRDVAPDAAERDRQVERFSPDPEGREARIVILEHYFLDAGSTDGTGSTGDTAGAPVPAAERMARHAEAGWLDTPGVIEELTPREAAVSTDPEIRAELRSMIDDVEATLLQARRAGRPTAVLMSPQRLRDALNQPAS